MLEYMKVMRFRAPGHCQIQCHFQVIPSGRCPCDLPLVRTAYRLGNRPESNRIMNKESYEEIRSVRGIVQKVMVHPFMESNERDGIESTGSENKESNAAGCSE